MTDMLLYLVDVSILIICAVMILLGVLKALDFIFKHDNKRFCLDCNKRTEFIPFGHKDGVIVCKSCGRLDYG